MKSLAILIFVVFVIYWLTKKDNQSKTEKQFPQLPGIVPKDEPQYPNSGYLPNTSSTTNTTDPRNPKLAESDKMMPLAIDQSRPLDYARPASSTRFLALPNISIANTWQSASVITAQT